MPLSLMIIGFDADPDEITNLLQLTPTEIGRKGEPRRNGKPRSFNGWWLTVEGYFTDGGQHDIALEQILAEIRGKEALFARLRETLRPKTVTLFGALHKRFDEQCGIGLDVAQMRLLADCGIDWGVDLYVDEETQDGASPAPHPGA